MRLYTRWLNLSQNLLLDVTNLRLFFLCSAVISKMLKYAEINILDITVEHLDNTIEHIRWLSHS